MYDGNLLSVKDLRTHLFLLGGKVLKAVDGVDLSVDAGEAVGLVGESGCGKTMTALTITRLIPTPPAQVVGGQILFKGTDLLKLSPEKIRKFRGKEISMIFQDPMTFLNPVMKVGDQIVEAILINQDVKKSEAKEKVIQTLNTVRIGSPSRVASQYPHQLSGGMRQRVLLSIALSCKPSLLIADEPTTALDATVQAQLLMLIKGIREEMNLSILLITHDLGVVAELCDKVYVMYAGKIVEEGDIFSLFRDPKHPYTQGLLRAAIHRSSDNIPYIDGTVPDLTNPPIGCRFNTRCPYAMPICKEKDPPKTEASPGNYVSCFLHA